ncbi:3066_t:CDS:10 [Ambispora leptoticha]|uniref:3066_t:CDS:1 n=1 Tax=Ambispora leptoticha TaxID=144679 RepID=A0A9N9C1C7_9GLOM|nr:3066_t:CDS:10 [Ambispora leptoticha]
MQSSPNEKTHETSKDYSAVVSSTVTKDSSTNILSEESVQVATEKELNDNAVTSASNAIAEFSSNRKESHSSRTSSIEYTVTKTTKVGQVASVASVSDAYTQSSSNQADFETPVEMSLSTSPNYNEGDLQKELSAAMMMNREIRQSSNETKSPEDPTVVIAQYTEIPNENELENLASDHGLENLINESELNSSVGSLVDDASDSNVKALSSENEPHLPEASLIEVESESDNHSLFSKEEVNSHEDWFIENASDIETQAPLYVEKEPGCFQKASAENNSDIEMDKILIEAETDFIEDSSVAIMSDPNIDTTIGVCRSSIESDSKKPVFHAGSQDILKPKHSISTLFSQIDTLGVDSDTDIHVHGAEMNPATFIPVSTSREQTLKTAKVNHELKTTQGLTVSDSQIPMKTSMVTTSISDLKHDHLHVSESEPIDEISRSAPDTRFYIARLSNPNSPDIHNVPYLTRLTDSPIDNLRNSRFFPHSESPISINLKPFLDIIPSMESKYMHNQQLSLTPETNNTQIKSSKTSNSVEENKIFTRNGLNSIILRNIAHKYFPPERKLSESLSICQQSANLFEFQSCIHESNPVILAENEDTTPSRGLMDYTALSEYGNFWGAKPSRWLYISNVPKNTDRRALINLLWAQGEVNNVLVGLLDSEGLIYVVYYDIRDAMKARKVLQGYLLGDSYLNAEFCSRPFSKKAADLDDLEQWEWDNEGIILLHVLGRRLEESRIKNEFSIYGDILSVKPLLNSKNSQRMLIEYYDTRDAADAKQIADDKLIRNATLKIEFYNHEVYSWKAIYKPKEEALDNPLRETSPECGPNTARQIVARQNSSIIASGNRTISAHNAIDVAKIARGQDDRTTFMIRNIPNKYTQRMLLETLDATHKGQYDFIYLRIDFKNRCNVGYAFINFVDTNAVLSFIENRVGQARLDRKIPKQQRDEGGAGIPAKNLLLLWELAGGGTTIPSFPLVP